EALPGTLAPDAGAVVTDVAEAGGPGRLHWIVALLDDLLDLFRRHRHGSRFLPGGCLVCTRTCIMDAVSLPVNPPIPPMLAKLQTDLPRGDGWLYEPKWD